MRRSTVRTHALAIHWSLAVYHHPLDVKGTENHSTLIPQGYLDRLSGPLEHTWLTCEGWTYPSGVRRLDQSSERQRTSVDVHAIVSSLSNLRWIQTRLNQA